MSNNSNWKLADQYPPIEFSDFCDEKLESKDARYHNDEGDVMCKKCADEGCAMLELSRD